MSDKAKEAKTEVRGISVSAFQEEKPVGRKSEAKPVEKKVASKTSPKKKGTTAKIKYEKETSGQINQKKVGQKKEVTKNNKQKKSTSKQDDKKELSKKEPVVKFEQEKAASKQDDKKELSKKEEPTPQAKQEKTEDKKENTLNNNDDSTFETFKIASVLPEKESKVILRDVAKSTPIKEPAVPTAPVSDKKPQIITVMPDPKPTTQTPMASAVKLSAKEIKEREIQKALNASAKLPTPKRRKKSVFKQFGVARTILAITCVATIVFATIYFINLASKDMSIQVAATQSGINASYPSYIPRGYSISDITSSKGKIVMNFKSEDGSYTITEESSYWDSDGLLNNYIKEEYGDDYTVLKEQGLTIYMGGNWEAWVNGGVIYKLTVNSGSLTKKQMKAIATSFN